MFRQIDVRDLAAVLGMILLASGLALLSVPVALVVTGTLVFALAAIPLVRRGGT